MYISRGSFHDKGLSYEQFSAQWVSGEDPLQRENYFPRESEKSDTNIHNLHIFANRQKRASQDQIQEHNRHKKFSMKPCIRKIKHLWITKQRWIVIETVKETAYIIA